MCRYEKPNGFSQVFENISPHRSQHAPTLRQSATRILWENERASQTVSTLAALLFSISPTAPKIPGFRVPKARPISGTRCAKNSRLENYHVVLLTFSQIYRWYYYLGVSFARIMPNHKKKRGWKAFRCCEKDESNAHAKASARPMCISTVRWIWFRLPVPKIINSSNYNGGTYQK